MKHIQLEPIGGGRTAKMTIEVDCDGDADLSRQALMMLSMLEDIFKVRCSMLARAVHRAERLSSALLGELRDKDCGCG